MLNRAPYGAYAVDMSQVIVFWNRSAERIVGFKAGDAIGRRCYEVLQSLPEQGTVLVCMEGCPAIRLAREGRVPPVIQVRMRCASGRRKLVTVVSNTVGHGWCSPACTPRKVDPVVTADIKLRRSIYQNDPLTFPGSDLIANKDDIAFNSCRTTTGAYSTLVHEAGHALGIAYGNSGLGQDRNHPTIPDEAAMSYLTRHDCSPHPFDIMAIYALYQTDG